MFWWINCELDEQACEISAVNFPGKGITNGIIVEPLRRGHANLHEKTEPALRRNQTKVIKINNLFFYY